MDNPIALIIPILISMMLGTIIKMFIDVVREYLLNKLNNTRFSFLISGTSRILFDLVVLGIIIYIVLYITNVLG